MASTVRIDGSLPGAGTKGLIFSRGWGVNYEFAGAPAFRANQPLRLSQFGFPSPFDTDLEGALRGRGAFTQFLYLFKNGRCLKLNASTMTPVGVNAESDTASAWGLPAGWDSLDAVVPGRGAKIDFCYFCRGSEYMRFEWLQSAMSQGYPLSIDTSWQMSAPFDADLDGIIAGQDSLGNKMFPFNTRTSVVGPNGALAPAGPTSHLVLAPVFARYDFTAGGDPNQELDPRNVVTRWTGLLPLLDTGEAIDIALGWCDKALAALAGQTTPLLTTALTHHFMTGAPSVQQLASITTRMQAVRDRIDALPDKFQWTRGFGGVAQTVPDTLTEIGDDFSNLHGPNGRAAVLIHEAVHFTFSGGTSVDVPEWSGATINGVAFPVSGPVAGVDVSGIAYNAMTPDEAIENPSSYAAFAQEIAFNGNDMRFGSGRPQE